MPVPHSAEALEELSRSILESFTSQERCLTKSTPTPNSGRQIHDDLRIQHPEWIESNGEAPMCDFYEARLMDLLHFEPNGLN